MLQSIGVIIVIMIAVYSYYSGKKYQRQRSWSKKLQALMLGICIMAVAIGINAVITGLPITNHLYKTLPLNLINDSQEINDINPNKYRIYFAFIIKLFYP